MYNWTTSSPNIIGEHESMHNNFWHHNLTLNSKYFVKRKQNENVISTIKILVNVCFEFLQELLIDENLL